MRLSPRSARSFVCVACWVPALWQCDGGSSDGANGAPSTTVPGGVGGGPGATAPGAGGGASPAVLDPSATGGPGGTPAVPGSTISPGSGGQGPLPGVGGAANPGNAGNPTVGGMGAGGEPVPMVEPDRLDQTGAVPPIAVPEGNLVLEVCAPNVVRVMVSENDAFFTRSTLATAPKRCDADTPWGWVDGGATATLLTAELQVEVELATGRVSFLDGAGAPILVERARTLSPAMVQGESVWNVQQEWEPQNEALYGLGQHQQNLMNIKSYPLDLVQYNTEIVVPFFVSSAGYGVLWDNTSWTRWGDLGVPQVLSAGGNYEGTFTAEVSGEHLFQTWASGDIKLYIDGELRVDHWRQGWLPGLDYAKTSLEAGQSVSLRVEFASDIDVEIATLSVTPPAASDATSLWSEVADGLDYTFVHGPSLDRVIAGYRRLTGEAPMMPKWAHGLWQCRERYETADEVTGVLEGFRSRGIPIDAIVQDWQFWVPGTWGSHDFDLTRFPDPAGWIQSIHDEYDAQLMVSVWPKFNAGADSYQELDAAGFLYDINKQENILDFTGEPMSYYDAFNADARAMFWSQINEDLFSLGVDAWWMDATEPEVVEGPYESPEQHRTLYQTHMHPTAMGTGSRMLNAYSLVNSQGVYEGQRSVAPDQRVFILTRSAFAGQQRYASASWSGDISTTWTAFEKQLPAGLNFVLSGIPYWTMDIGGFAEHPRFPGDGAEWEELNTRWFQWGTFVPLLRVHGQDDRTGPREMWNFGEQTYQAHLKFDRIRYRLMPYVYSLAGDITQRAGTMMRPLVMDFRADEAVWEIWDQYMFGPALLVNPVTDYQARSRSVYLPQTSGGWYDFWTGESQAGGQTLDAPAPYDSIPVFVRAGSIIPVGPEIEFTDQAPADPITLFVYTGANGAFTLYEDDGLTYGYENGAFTEIPLSYDEASGVLTIGARNGQFDGMLSERTFQVVAVSAASAVGFDPVAVPTGVVATYDGTALEVPLR